jgi:hypothetical protein
VDQYNPGIPFISWKKLAGIPGKRSVSLIPDDMRSDAVKTIFGTFTCIYGQQK